MIKFRPYLLTCLSCISFSLFPFSLYNLQGDSSSKTGDSTSPTRRTREAKTDTSVPHLWTSSRGGVCIPHLGTSSRKGVRLASSGRAAAASSAQHDSQVQQTVSSCIPLLPCTLNLFLNNAYSFFIFFHWLRRATEAAVHHPSVIVGATRRAA